MRKLLALFLLTACSAFSYPEQPGLLNGPTTGYTDVEVIWLKDFDEVKAACMPSYQGTVYACSRKTWAWAGFHWKTVCTIYSIKPKDFNDDFNLNSLGHELFHCLGAEHG